MEEIIIREGDQITISAKEYYDLLLWNRISTIVVIGLAILFGAVLLYLILDFIIKHYG